MSRPGACIGRRWLTLLRREWWEHRGGFLLAPLAVLVVVLLGATLVLGAASSQETTLRYETQEQHGADTSTRTFEWQGSLVGLLDFRQWSKPEFERRAARFRALIAQPFVIVHFLVAVFVLLGSLHDDRKDRSVLFWKSMPVGDVETVASKLVLAVWVAPLVTVTAILLAQLGTLGLLSVFGHAAGAGGVGQLWLHAGLPAGTLTLLTGYLVQGLWALPVYAWLLLVSAAAAKVPFVWALLVPAGLAALESVALGSAELWDWLNAHLRLAALPRPPGSLLGTGFGDATAEPGVGLPEQLALLFSAEMASGLAVAALLLAAAVHFRRRNNDL